MALIVMVNAILFVSSKRQHKDSIIIECERKCVYFTQICLWL